MLLLAMGWHVTGLLAADRVALVIGNNDYPMDGALESLKNCMNDARLIGSALKGVGFEVSEHYNLTRGQMDDALLVFEQSIPDGAEAVVYFAGHGIEVDGKNYLLGTNARLRAKSRLGEEALDMETFARAMLNAGSKASFLFLDCCREAPPAEWLTRGIKKRGLAGVTIDGDIIISYAAGPGGVALDQPVPDRAQEGGILLNNSPYAQALAALIPKSLKHTDLILELGQDVHRLTGGRQRPWSSGSFLRPHFFGTPRALPVDEDGLAIRSRNCASKAWARWLPKNWKPSSGAFATCPSSSKR